MMEGRKLLNNTLKINAFFSLISGIDFIFFDKDIGKILSGGDFESLAPTGVSLIVFSIFVFVVSMLKKVNKWLVTVIILMDVLWVISSIFIVAMNPNLFSTLGIIIILFIAGIIGLFAYFQTKGLRMCLKTNPIV